MARGRSTGEGSRPAWPWRSGLLAWFSRASRSPRSADAARRARGWFAAAVCAALASYALRAFAGESSSAPLGPAPTVDLLGCNAAGFATSAILPARAGELVRPLLLTARTRLPAAGTIASILVERIADLVTVLLMFGVSALFARGPSRRSALRPVRDAAALALLGVAALLAVMFMPAARREAAVRSSSASSGSPAARGERLLHHVPRRPRGGAQPAALARLFAWSFAVWLLAAAQVQWLRGRSGSSTRCRRRSS